MILLSFEPFILNGCSSKNVSFSPFFSGPTDEEERLAAKVKKLESELSKAKKDSDSQRSIDGRCLYRKLVMSPNVLLQGDGPLPLPPRSKCSC